MGNTVQETLNERGTRYGKFVEHAKIAQNLQTTMRYAPGWYDLKPDQAQALTVIADKIARILNGDPNYIDNWHDIQGYAKLVEDQLKEKELANQTHQPDADWSASNQQHTQLPGQ